MCAPENKDKNQNLMEYCRWFFKLMKKPWIRKYGLPCELAISRLRFISSVASLLISFPPVASLLLLSPSIVLLLVSSPPVAPTSNVSQHTCSWPWMAIWRRLYWAQLAIGCRVAKFQLLVGHGGHLELVGHGTHLEAGWGFWGSKATPASWSSCKFNSHVYNLWLVKDLEPSSADHYFKHLNHFKI